MDKITWKTSQPKGGLKIAKAFNGEKQIAEIHGADNSGYWTVQGFICNCSEPFPKTKHGLAAAMAYVESWHAEALEVLK